MKLLEAGPLQQRRGLLDLRRFRRDDRQVAAQQNQQRALLRRQPRGIVHNLDARARIQLLDLGFQERSEAPAAHFRQKQRAVLACRIARERHGDLRPQVLAEGPDLVQDLIELRLASRRLGLLGPPLAQHLALLDLLAEQPLRLPQRGTQVGRRSVEHRALRGQIEKPGRIAQAGAGNGLQFLAQRRQLAQHSDVGIHIAAPGDLVLDRNLRQAGVGRDLLAGLQHAGVPALGHLHFAFDHRDPRTFHPAIHRENGPLHRDRAILSSHVTDAGNAAWRPRR